MPKQLSDLHDAIAQIAPIHGISDNGDGTYRIDWVEPPGGEQQTVAEEAIQAWQNNPDLDWAGLLDDLQESAAFARAYGAANESIPALNALTMVIASLTSTFRLNNLLFGFGQLRAAMPLTQAGDFSEADLIWLSDRLIARGFPVEQFGLVAPEP